MARASCSALRRRRWFGAAKEFRNDNLTRLAAALTYYAVLSVVPGLIVLISVVGFVGHNVASRVTSQVESLVPGSIAAFVHSLINQAQHQKGGAGITAVIGLVIALWSTSSYVNAFRQASNIIYGIGEGRPIWKTIPLRLGVTVVAVVVLVVSAVIVVVSGPVANQVGSAVGAGWAAVVVWDIANSPVLLVPVAVLLAVLFWASPMPSRAASDGSVAEGSSRPFSGWQSRPFSPSMSRTSPLTKRRTDPWPGSWSSWFGCG